LKFSQSFETQWNLLCWKYKINKFYFGTNTKSTNLTKKKMNTLISTFHFRLHNSMAHLSNALKFSRSFDTQWNLSCSKYKFNKCYFGTNTKFTNLWIHELVIFNQTTKIDTHKEKYFNSSLFWYQRVIIQNE
jgi:hypothetical protein